MENNDLLLLNQNAFQKYGNLKDLNTTSVSIIRKYLINPADYRDLYAYMDLEIMLNEQFEKTISDYEVFIFDYPKLLNDIFMNSKFTDKSITTLLTVLFSEHNLFFYPNDTYTLSELRENAVFADCIHPNTTLSDLIELWNLIFIAITGKYTIYYFEKVVD